MSEHVIKVKNLTKYYKLYDEHVDRMREALDPLRRKLHHDFYALKNLNFEVRKGETLGIVGKNGAGKSTLLKILTGVLTPSDGEVEVIGRVASLLELGVGFNPELTGRENVFFNGAILGFSKEEMQEKLSGVLEFADIGEYIDQPVKSYSSGMYMRLAFAVAINVDPDILIIDEALSVGDVRFQQNCFRHLKALQTQGKTIIFVTHDTGAVINFCERALWIDDGCLKAIGDAEEVCRDYMAYMTFDVETEKGVEINEDSVKSEREHRSLLDVGMCDSFGEGAVKIKSVGLSVHGDNSLLQTFRGGQRVDFEMSLEVLGNVDIPVVGFVLSDSYGNKVFGLNTELVDCELGSFKAGSKMNVMFSFDFPFLKNGKYTFSPAVAEGTLDNHIHHHWVHDAYVVEVASDTPDARMGWYFLLQNCEVKAEVSND